MNPLFVSAAFAFNVMAIVIIGKFLLMHLVVIIPDGPWRDGLAALL